VDANGTRFHLLLGQADWASSSMLSLAWDPVRSEVTLQPRLLRVASSAGAAPLAIDQRRGAARDRFGNWYWIAAGGDEILVRSAGSDATSHFWSAGDGECESSGAFGQFRTRSIPAQTPARLSGLAVTEDHYLVVGVLQPAGIRVFDLHATHPPRELLWPAQVAFVPFDIAARSGGGVWILDRANARLWELDRSFSVRADGQDQIAAPAVVDTFRPRTTAGTPRQRTRTFPGGVPLGGSPGPAPLDPVAVEPLAAGTVLILDRSPGQPFGRISAYQSGRPTGAPMSLSILATVLDNAEAASPLRLNGHDLAFIPAADQAEGLLGTLYVVADDGSQVFAFGLSRHADQMSLAPLETFLPMRQFAGKGLVAADGKVYYDFEDRWLPLLEQPRARYEPDGQLQTRLLDGREPDCVWHRLMLDACIPPDTRVQVWSRAADERADVEVAAWQREPGPYLRGNGSEQPVVSDSPRASSGHNGTWELLFQRARGRYLQVQLGLVGNGRTTPRIRALRAYYPRFSYLDHYLPAAYRDDDVSASFLDRFLANLEGIYTTLEDRIASVEALFDQRSAPSETLAWLAGWFGLVLDPAWGERRRRLLIKHAMEFFQYRGTLLGLEMALRFLLDDWPDETIFGEQAWRNTPGSGIRIVEEYHTRRSTRVGLGDPTGPLQPGPQLARSRWSPNQGASELNRRYLAFVRDVGLGAPPTTRFPLVAPVEPSGLQAAWAQFANSVLGFVPRAGPSDVTAWRDFLARRYATVDALNSAHGTALAALDQVPLPALLPLASAAVRDWYQFETVVLPMRGSAHRFTVLLPVTGTGAQAAATSADLHQHRLDLASRLLDLERPAHTVCAVKLYWPLFRVGGVRLGTDTVLDRGSRAPELMPPLVLQQGSLAESYLAPAYPWDLSDRQVVGRDRLLRGNTQ
jgi:phage tail-like protein